MKINTPISRFKETTHEGAPAYSFPDNLTAEQALRRSVMSCMLWEDEFYEDGKSITSRIASLIPQVEASKVAAIAIEARTQMKLRHIPLFIVREMARHPEHKKFVRATLATVIQRADELSEFLAIYWKDGRCKLAKSVQRGLADAFVKFSPYDLAKYNQDGAVKLRDVLFLSHAKPKDKEQEEVFKSLVAGTLPSPDTWEVALSAGADKKETWIRLISERKLGALALLRNLRNMQKVNVPDSIIAGALREMNPDRVLPFRFIAALQFAPQFAAELDVAMLKNLEQNIEKLTGNTVVLIDVSGSMDAAISAKSDLQRIDAATGLGIFARELCERVRIFTFSDTLVEVPNYRGLALAKLIKGSQFHSGTQLGAAIQTVNMMNYDRIIVITDEQSHSYVPGPNGKGYMINVASNKNGVGYGPWIHIDGWSERVLNYIIELEKK